MTEEIKTTDNNQKMSAYCKTCICKSCEQVAWLEQENKEMKSALEEIKGTVQKGMYSLKKGYSREYQDTLSNIFNKINEVIG